MARVVSALKSLLPAAMGVAGGFVVVMLFGSKGQPAPAVAGSAAGSTQHISIGNTSAPSGDIDEEGQLRDAIARQDALLKRFASLPPGDERWAGTTRAALQSKLTEVSASHPSAGFEVESTECREGMCIAKLRWGNYGNARDTARDVATAQTIPCATEVTIPPPTDPTQAYTATVVYICSDPR